MSARIQDIYFAATRASTVPRNESQRFPTSSFFLLTSNFPRRRISGYAQIDLGRFHKCCSHRPTAGQSRRSFFKTEKRPAGPWLQPIHSYLSSRPPISLCSLDQTNCRSGRDSLEGDEVLRDRPNHMSRAQDVITNLLAFADIRINGARPWDIEVHDRPFFGRVLASGTAGFGEC